LAVVVAVLAVACGKENPKTFLGPGPKGGSANSARGGAGDDIADEGGASGNADVGETAGRTSNGGRSGQTSTGGRGGSGSGGEPSTGDAGAPTTYDLSSFDPNEVYIYGTLVQGRSGVQAIAHWATPNYYLLGFGTAHHYNLEVVNGALLYSDSGSIRQFVPEFASSLDFSHLNYPKNAEANDLTLNTPPCQDGVTGQAAFLASPDGRLIYKCPDKVWYEAGTPVFDTNDMTAHGDLVAFGNDGMALLDDLDFTIINLATGEKLTPIQDAAGATIVTVRAVKDGFHIVVTPDTNGTVRELWSVTANAVATKLGDFGPLPAPIEQINYGAKLSGSDELFESGYESDGDFNDVIIRRSINEASAIVYTEASQPRVLLHGSLLFTGP